MIPRMVVSDLDGTFLDDAERVPPRLRQAVARLDAAGVPLVLATGRPARWVEPIIKQLPIRPLCVCANGAVIYDSARREVLSAQTLAAATQCNVVDSARRALGRLSVGQLGVAAERIDSFVVSPEFVHSWESDEHLIQPEAQVLGAPAIKLLLRNPQLSSKEMFDVVRPLIPDSDAHITFSMDDGLLEVAAPGVTKAHGLDYIAARLGIDPADTVCFGDMPNDSEMLAWAGLGVAMGNARPEVKAAADEVTLDNNACGVAHVLERWF